MKTLTKDNAIQVGGKAWSKDTLERVYLDIAAINALKIQNGYAAIVNVSKKMSKAKTFLNVATGEIFSDVGMIRSELNGIGFDCNK